MGRPVALPFPPFPLRGCRTLGLFKGVGLDPLLRAPYDGARFGLHL
jgi:hypothetical protein